MNTLYLSPQNWDLTLDNNGNIAMATEPYSLAQDAASAIKTFLGEVYYDTTQGVPYFGQILGQTPSLQFLKSQLVAAAMTVPDVVSAVCYITGITGRQLSGQVQVTDTSGVISAAGF